MTCVRVDSKHEARALRVRYISSKLREIHTSMRLAALELKDIVWALLLDFPFFDFGHGIVMLG